MCTIFVNVLYIHIVVVGHNISNVIFIYRREEEIPLEFKKWW